MADEAPIEEDQQQATVVHTYPLVRHSDMMDEMRTECIDMIITACEKYASNYEVISDFVHNYLHLCVHTAI